MGILNEAASALPQVFELLGKKASFTLRGYSRGITPGAGVSGVRAKQLTVAPTTVQGYVTKKSVYLVATSIPTISLDMLNSSTTFWTVQKFDHSKEQNVDGKLRRFAPDDDLIWTGDLEQPYFPPPGGP